MKQTCKTLLLLIAVIFITALPLMGFHLDPGADSEIFAGDDDKAMTVIEEISPGYEPWAEALWEPTSGEIASMLFALQAALGAGFIGYYIGSSRSRHKGLT